MPSCDDLVERRGDLVADDQLGLGGERAGDADALLLAARQLARQRSMKRSSSSIMLEQLGDPRVAARWPLQAEIELERPADDVAHASGAG